MAALASMGLAQICFWCFGLTFASAVFPWVNSEIIVLSLPAVATSKFALLLLLLVATGGQMTGKCVLYWAGRRGDKILPGKAGKRLAIWRQRLESRPARAPIIVLVSAITGLPPFYVMTLLAGALRMNFPLFLAVGTIGRFVHFAALVTLPHLALSWYRGA